MSAWKAAGVSYLKYAEACAQAVRNVVKDEFKVAAQRRSENIARYARWEGGKASDSKNVAKQ